MHFIKSSADQLYRLGRTRTGPGQLHQQSAHLEPDFRIVVVPPSEGGHYHQLGRLRVLLGEDAALVNVSARINGHTLTPSANTSALFDEGPQATLGRYPDSYWRAFDVLPNAQLVAGNNSVGFVLSAPPPPPSEAGYTLTYTGAHGSTKGSRFRFPFPHTSASYRGPRVNGGASSQPTLEACQEACDQDAQCKGVYYGAGGDMPEHTCYTLHSLAKAGTGLHGASYTKTNRTTVSRPRLDLLQASAGIQRLELSLPVVPP
eukprot:COSAG05_NODE_663_length_8031_cov_8.938225_3_plen_260_part_00